MKNFDVILFDVDDTLIDFQKSQKYALNKTFDDFNLQCNEIIEDKYNKINKEFWEEYNKGNVTKYYMKVERFNRLFSEFNLNCNPAKFNDVYLANLAENSVLIDNAENICNLLSKNFRLVIVTNAIPSVANRKIDKAGIRQYFSGVFISDDLGVQKPDKRFFDCVFKGLGDINLDRVIIVGDSLTSDIQGGINAGIATCWYNRFGVENETDINPTYEIRDLEELFEIVGYEDK